MEKLGTNCLIPVEVLPFALATATADIKELGGKSLLRESKGKVGAVVTDNGNYIVDVDFGLIDDAEELNHQLKRLGADKALEKAGVKPGDKIRCGELTWEW